MPLSRFPRLTLAHLPTPLEPLERLGDHLAGQPGGGPRLYVKRDDCTGLASGGNKTRKLEFLLAEALEQGCDTIVTEGGRQSNHVRQTAAAAARLGLACELVLQEAHFWDDPDYDVSGNIFLDRLLGATLHGVACEADRKSGMARVAEAITRRGGKPYVIPAGGSTALGGLGYAGCAFEIAAQAETLGITVDHIVLASGSGGTQGGLVAGLLAIADGGGGAIPALGIDIDADPEGVPARVRAVAEGTAGLLDVTGGVPLSAVAVNSDYAGQAYGAPTEAMVEAVTLLARLEGLLLDPVYSGKAMAGLIDLVRRGFFAADDTVVFIHTGGLPALFAYRGAFEDLRLE